MTRNKIIKKLVVALAAAAVLFAITSNVAEAAKINPNPIGKPVTGGTVFEGKKGEGSVDCLYEHSLCITGNYTSGDVAPCRSGRAGKKCRLARQKVRCKYAYKRCKIKEKKKARKTLPSTTGTIMNTVPMKQYKMAPTKQK
jgi:hypothetical protein